MLNMRSQKALPLVAPLADILADVPGYHVKNQVMDDESRKLLGNTDYMARVYYRDSLLAFTALVSYYERQTQGKTIHSPRNCLPGAGWEVLTAGTTLLAAAGSQYEVNRYVLKNGNQTALVYYWYQGRGRIVANEYAVKWNLLRDAAVAGHTEEALVRVMVPVMASTLNAEALKTATATADSLSSVVSRRLV